MLIDIEWLEFYRKWRYDQLLQEIETCHLYQRQILIRLGANLITSPDALTQVTLSQEREGFIQEIIREKVKADEL